MTTDTTDTTDTTASAAEMLRTLAAAVDPTAGLPTLINIDIHPHQDVRRLWHLAHTGDDAAEWIGWWARHGAIHWWAAGSDGPPCIVGTWRRWRVHVMWRGEPSAAEVLQGLAPAEAVA
jgi:hypothetical protein